MSRNERNKKNKFLKALHDDIRNRPDSTNSPDSTNRPDLNIQVPESSSDSDDDLFSQLRVSNQKAQANFLASINAPNLPTFDSTSATSGLPLLAALRSELPASSSAAYFDTGN